MRQFQTMSRGTEARDFNLLQDNAKYVQNWSAAQCFIVMLCTVVQVRYRTYLPSYLTALDLHPFAGGSGATIFSRSNSRFLGKIIKISRGYPSINKFLLFHSKFYIFVIGLFIYRPYLYFNIEILLWRIIYLIMLAPDIECGEKTCVFGSLVKGWSSWWISVVGMRPVSDCYGRAFGLGLEQF